MPSKLSLSTLVHAQVLELPPPTPLAVAVVVPLDPVDPAVAAESFRPSCSSTIWCEEVFRPSSHHWIICISVLHLFSSSPWHRQKASHIALSTIPTKRLPHHKQPLSSLFIFYNKKVKNVVTYTCFHLTIAFRNNCQMKKNKPPYSSQRYSHNTPCRHIILPDQHTDGFSQKSPPV